ncbi:retropepsin-like aspartic protease family protein [Ferribacterium limneticum]|uniref:retropepsin-like aspartic protease family protein n=1 Tax=Ferribacterium limneticum TaxID=76259 RepID=UPI001CFC06CD|nr:TIGR02281 family clan AA aspartic protease [Ferribacterium limneticum]
MVKMSGKLMRHSTLLAVLVCLFQVPAMAQDVGLAGIMGSKAMLMINGGEPQAVPVGQTVDGVKVLSIQGDQATIEVGGKKRPLRVGQHAIGTSSGDGSGKVTMTADGQGHFFTTGTVNGTSVRFVVDTGATFIALGPSDARRIGIDPNKGKKAMASTANGNAVYMRVMLDTVRIGDITLHNVEAGILPTEMPAALLGMSFLNRMEMQRDGSTMTLKKRF